MRWVGLIPPIANRTSPEANHLTLKRLCYRCQRDCSLFTSSLPSSLLTELESPSTWDFSALGLKAYAKQQVILWYQFCTFVFLLMIYCGDGCNQSAISRHFHCSQPFATTDNDAVFSYRHKFCMCWSTGIWQIPRSGTTGQR